MVFHFKFQKGKEVKTEKINKFLKKNLFMLFKKNPKNKKKQKTAVLGVRG